MERLIDIAYLIEGNFWAIRMLMSLEDTNLPRDMKAQLHSKLIEICTEIESKSGYRFEIYNTAHLPALQKVYGFLGTPNSTTRELNDYWRVCLPLLGSEQSHKTGKQST